MNRNYLSIVIVVAALLLGALLVWPQYQKISSLKTDIESKRLDLQTKTDYFNKVKQVSDELGGYSDSLAKVYSALPNDPMLSSTFNYIQTTASEAGLVLTEVKVDSIGKLVNSGKKGEKTVSSDPDLRSTTLNFTLEGSYSSLKNFLSETETSSRLIDVEDVSFTKPSKVNDPFDFNNVPCWVDSKLTSIRLYPKSA